MLPLNLMGLAHDGVERSETHHLRLSPADHRSEEAWLAFRERAVDLAPELPDAISPSNQHGRRPELQGRGEAPYERSDVHRVPLAAEGQLLRPSHHEPDEAVGSLGLGGGSKTLRLGDVADYGDVSFGGLHGAVFRERLQGAIVPRLADDGRERVPLPTHDLEHASKF